MKAQRWINILVVLALVLGHVRLEQSMAIDFESGTTNQGIVFGDVAVLKNLTTKTMCVLFNAESSDAFNVLLHINYNYGYGYTSLLAAGKIRFGASWNGSLDDFAYWDSNAALSTGTEYLVCVTYDNSSTANNPLFYVNGLSVALTEIESPAGTIVDSGGTTKIGGFGVLSGTPFDGIIRDVRVYNRILAAGEILDLYNSKGADHNDYGLVFHVPMISAAGLQTFGGGTLTNTSYVYDRISGLQGTPSGSPVGVADTILTYVDDH